MKTTLLQTALAALLGLITANTALATAIPLDQTIGAPLVQRSTTDLISGGIVALNDGFTVSGTLSDWAFFNDNSSQIGMVVTPLLLQKVGSDYFVLGVGTSRANNGSGVQSYGFGLTAGSDSVAPGCLFGWKDGTDADPLQQGVIQFDFVGAPVAGTQQLFYSGTWGVGHSGDLIPGNNLGAGFLLGADINVQQPDRDYSVQATVTVPEPSSIALAGLGIAVLLARSSRVQQKARV